MNRKSDSEIRTEVSRELKWDSRIGWSEIGVEVMEGVVTLTGVVSSCHVMYKHNKRTPALLFY